jgi:peptidoglycan/LPS O-acetylase OafA/YrhL
MGRSASDLLTRPPDGPNTPIATARPDYFRPDVEGLRAIAVMCVVLCHVGIPRFIEGGASGVDVFFVISGYVITGVLLRERDSSGRTSLVSFYSRRARRIIPMAVLVIVIVVIVDRVVDGATLAQSVEIQGRWDALFQSNLGYLQSYLHDVYTGPPGPPSVDALIPYWSLSVEEQFYLVYPALILLVATIPGRLSIRLRLGLVLTAVVIASFSWSVESSPGSIVAYVSTLTRAWELAIGALLAVAEPWFRRIPGPFAALMSWAGIAGILFVALTFTTGGDWPGSAAAWPVAATALVIGGGAASPRFGAVVLLKLSPFKWLALWSFSLYLWNEPINSWALQLKGGSLTLLDKFGVMGIAIAIAALSFFVVENPIRRSRFLRRSGWVSIVLGLSLIASCVILTIAI